MTPETGAPLANAGVRFPPPFIYFIAIIVSFVVNRLVPLYMAKPEPRWMFFGGLGLVALGVVISFSGAITFRLHHTAIIPHKPASTIVASSPYAFTRNPMYLGLGFFSSASRWCWIRGGRCSRFRSRC